MGNKQPNGDTSSTDQPQPQPRPVVAPPTSQPPPPPTTTTATASTPPNQGQEPRWWTRGKVTDIDTPADWEEKSKFIKDTTHNTLVVVEFQAPWCGPSRFIAPFIERQAEANQNVLFVRLNYDNMEKVATQEGVDVVPTFILYKGGKKMPNPIVGARRADLSARIEKYKN